MVEILAYKTFRYIDSFVVVYNTDVRFYQTFAVFRYRLYV